MRLFAAIDLDESARAAIAQEQKRIASAMGESQSAVRWVHANQMHLTLVFLGDCSDGLAASVVDALSRPVSVHPFAMTFQGVGVFPPHGSPRALWIGAGDGTRPLVELQREIANRISACGGPVDARPFQPHLTLGRWRQSRPSDRRGALAHATPHVVARVRVDAATLYRSQLSSAGSTYTVLARARLSPC